jgi:hypothetical protein
MVKSCITWIPRFRIRMSPRGSGALQQQSIYLCDWQPAAYPVRMEGSSNGSRLIPAAKGTPDATGDSPPAHREGKAT